MKNQFQKPFWLLFPCLILCLQACIQDTENEVKATVKSIFESDTLLGYREFIDRFPVLELPFPKRIESGPFAGLPESLGDYAALHPELRIPLNTAKRHLMVEAETLENWPLHDDEVRITAIGKVPLPNYEILLYQISRWQGNVYATDKNGVEHIDSVYLTESRISSRLSFGLPFMDYLFGFNHSRRYPDYAVGELLPDLTVNVYENPHTVVAGPENPCRRDHFIVLNQYGIPEVKVKDYCLKESKYRAKDRLQLEIPYMFESLK